MEPGISAIDDINVWFGIEMLDEHESPRCHPNHLEDEPEEQAQYLTRVIQRVTKDRLSVEWHFERMNSMSRPVYRLSLDGRPTSIRTRTGMFNYHKEVSDLVAELNGWDRKKLIWYRMGQASQLRFGYKHVVNCFDNLSLEDAVAAAIKFAGEKWVGLC